jgi:RNA polymerase-interacting CarD/CdnL/TRCF family regulator
MQEFKVGDHVIHASQGSGYILAVEEKQVAGNDPKLFYAVAIEKGTVWVPVETGTTSRLRLTVSHSDLDYCRAILRGKPSPLNINHRQRSLDLATRLQQGTFEGLCELLRDLTAYSWPKPLSEADTQKLRKTRDAVCLEWANAVGVTPAEALREVNALLSEAQKTYSG